MTVASIDIDVLIRSRIRTLETTLGKLKDTQIIEACEDVRPEYISRMRHLIDALSVAIDEIEEVRDGG
jgi:hypothetical protein